jgi:hypothetical protein
MQMPICTNQDPPLLSPRFHMSDVRYVRAEGIHAHSVFPGHGKLLWDPNLGDRAFATNTNEPVIYELSLDLKEDAKSIPLPQGEISPYPCSRTHGIAYSHVSRSIYVECSNPVECDGTAGDDASVCTGSVWQVSVDTLEVVERFVSPKLDDLYGSDYGMMGQIHSVPNEEYLVVTDKMNDMVHFIKPREDGGAEIVEVEVAGGPGKIAFWHKDDTSDDNEAGRFWSAGADLSGFVLAIALEASTATSGLATIDMSAVVDAFDNGEEAEVPVRYAELGAGAKYRPIARGADFIATPSGATSEYGGYTELAIVNLRDESTYTLDIPDTGRVLWVPHHTDDVNYRITQLENIMATNGLFPIAAPTTSNTANNTNP